MLVLNVLVGSLSVRKLEFNRIGSRSTVPAYAKASAGMHDSRLMLHQATALDVVIHAESPNTDTTLVVSGSRLERTAAPSPAAKADNTVGKLWPVTHR